MNSKRLDFIFNSGTPHKRVVKRIVKVPVGVPGTERFLRGVIRANVRSIVKSDPSLRTVYVVLVTDTDPGEAFRTIISKGPVGRFL